MMEKGIEKEFAKIYKVYFPRLVRFSETYLSSFEEAENLVQDIFLYLWEHPEVFQNLSSRHAFLFTMVKNRCIDYLRKQADERKHPLSELKEKELKFKLYSLQLFDENILDEIDIASVIEKAIESLPSRCREIFILSRMKGLKHKEIAAKLEISTNTIETQIGIALSRLRKDLRKHLLSFLFLI